MFLRTTVINMGRVAAFLTSILAMPASVSALNLTIGNTTTDAGEGISRVNIGQSFINEPGGSGATINLNSWVFGFDSSANALSASNRPLSIFIGLGTGGPSGMPIGSSVITTLTPVTGYEFPVTWTFVGGLPIIDTTLYTAVIFSEPDQVPGLKVTGTVSAYPNGTVTDDAKGVIAFDAAFQGNFSAVPVPFEFSPAVGILGLGGIYAGRIIIKKLKASKKSV